MGDQQQRAPGRGGQEIPQQRRAHTGIEMGRGLVEDQQLRIGEQGPGQGQPLALAAGQRGAVRADRRVPAERQRSDPVQQLDPGGGLGELLVGGRGPGQPEVFPQRRVEDMRILRAATDPGPDVVRGVAGQVVAVERDACPRSGWRSGAARWPPSTCRHRSGRSGRPVVPAAGRGRCRPGRPGRRAGNGPWRRVSGPTPGRRAAAAARRARVPGPARPGPPRCRGPTPGPGRAGPPRRAGR